MKELPDLFKLGFRTSGDGCTRVVWLRRIVWGVYKTGSVVSNGKGVSLISFEESWTPLQLLEEGRVNKVFLTRMWNLSGILLVFCKGGKGGESVFRPTRNLWVVAWKGIFGEKGELCFRGAFVEGAGRVGGWIVKQQSDCDPQKNRGENRKEDVGT